MRFLNALLDAFYPRYSLSDKEGEFVLEAELAGMKTGVMVLDRFDLLSEGISKIDALVSATSAYHGSPLLRAAIKKMKYRRVRSISKQLGQLLVEASRFLDVKDDTVLCPVPLHWRRQFDRGFNQAELLASIVAAHTGMSVRQLLVRRRSTGHQAARDGQSRRQEMRNTFSIKRGTLPSHVILIDDIATTGATLEACALALKEHGVVRVDALVLARG